MKVDKNLTVVPETQWGFCGNFTLKPGMVIFYVGGKEAVLTETRTEYNANGQYEYAKVFTQRKATRADFGPEADEKTVKDGLKLPVWQGEWMCAYGNTDEWENMDAAVDAFDKYKSEAELIALRITAEQYKGRLHKGPQFYMGDTRYDPSGYPGIYFVVDTRCEPFYSVPEGPELITQKDYNELLRIEKKYGEHELTEDDEE